MLFHFLPICVPTFLLIPFVFVLFLPFSDLVRCNTGVRLIGPHEKTFTGHMSESSGSNPLTRGKIFVFNTGFRLCNFIMINFFLQNHFFLFFFFTYCYILTLSKQLCSSSTGRRRNRKTIILDKWVSIHFQFLVIYPTVSLQWDFLK